MAQWGHSWSLLLAKYYSCDQNKKRSYFGVWRGWSWGIYRVWWGNLRERTNWMSIVNNWVAWKVCNCFTNCGIVRFSERFLLRWVGDYFDWAHRWFYVINRKRRGLTATLCILHNNGLGSFNRFPSDCELISLPVGCAICWNFRESVWTLMTFVGKTGSFCLHAEDL
jgi:hypothetical protein